MLKDALERLGLPLNVGLEVSTIDTLKHYVALGLGIAAISGLCLSDDDRTQFEMLEVPADIGDRDIVRGDETNSNSNMETDSHFYAKLFLVGLRFSSDSNLSAVRAL